jgi:hypothetical protein
LSKTTSRQKSEVKGKVIDEKLERREQKQWIAIKNFENNFNNEANEFFITNIDEGTFLCPQRAAYSNCTVLWSDYLVLASSLHH